MYIIKLIDVNGSQYPSSPISDKNVAVVEFNDHHLSGRFVKIELWEGDTLIDSRVKS